MADIITNFNKGLDNYLTKDQLREICPIAFESGPTNPNVTKKYLFVNTEQIIDDLDKLGWKPVTAAMRKSRGKETIFSKHMVTFQNPDIKITGTDGDDSYPRIIMTNSHDGLQAFKFSVGIFRLVCSNGLVVADEKFSEFKIRHKGYTFSELRDVVSKAVKDLPNKVEVLNKMKNKILTKDEKEKLALDAMLIRAGITPDSDKAKKFEYDQETIEDILDPKRKEDKGDDLWKVFNVVQEKITQGEFHAALKGAQTKVRKVRKIKSFEKDLQVNKELFKLATALI
jgi:hypothetical protein|tara:strand:- start:116 stop:967 length:852 start_codon:yes stop_codon:yes gene_type:complete